MSDSNHNNLILEDKTIPEHIIVKKSTYNKLVVGIVLSLIAVSFFGGYILGQSTNKSVALENIIPIQTVPQTNPQPTSNPNQPSSKVFVSYQDSQMRGNQNTPATIVEFSDFQCPFCESFFPDINSSGTKLY